MAYDTDVTGSTLDVQIKRRTYRVDFSRPPVEGAGSISANCFLKEDAINVTEGSPKSGSIAASDDWLIGIDKNQIMGLPNAGSFLNGLVSFIDSLKTEYDASGSLATGSIRQIS